MWNFILAGIIGGVAYLALKKDDKKEQVITQTTKKKIVRTQKNGVKYSNNEENLTLLYAIQKEGFDSALRYYSTFPKIKDVEFHKLQKDYKKNAQSFVNYIESKNPTDIKYNLSSADVLDNEGLDYGFLNNKVYSTWKGVKDEKFHKLLLETKNSYNSLVSHIKSKFKIKNLGDDELYKAIDKLEGR
jgi:hypothetical protein